MILEAEHIQKKFKEKEVLKENNPDSYFDRSAEKGWWKL